MLTRKVNVPGHLNADAYMLDLDVITDDQREGLITVISARFQIPIDEVRSELRQGVPILAEGVMVGTSDQGMFFSMVGDDIHGDEWDLDADLNRHQEFEED
jgi:hypothetical protein